MNALFKILSISLLTLLVDCSYPMCGCPRPPPDGAVATDLRANDAFDFSFPTDIASPADMASEVISGGWRLIHRYDYTRVPCPSPWFKDVVQQICVRNSAGSGNKVVTFAMGARSYSAVQVVLTARMTATNDAFGDSARGPNPAVLADVPYADGIGIFSGTQHLWTLAHGNTGVVPAHNCPQNGGAAPPADVGMNYDCVTAAVEFQWLRSYTQKTTVITLPSPRTEDLQIALMGDQDSGDEDSGIRQLEIWIPVL